MTRPTAREQRIREIVGEAYRNCGPPLARVDVIRWLACKYVDEVDALTRAANDGIRAARKAATHKGE